jgi:hypothetical protein
VPVCGCLLALLWAADLADAACRLTTVVRKFEGAERKIVVMENDRILVEVVPELEGRVSRYVDKTKRPSKNYFQIYGARGVTV